MLESNARLLAARFPVVLDRILKAGERISDSFFYESDGGKEILSLQRGEHSFPVYGKNRRDQILKRWFSGLKLAKESLYAITGFGDGSHIRYFLNESSSGTNFLVAEKDPVLLRETFARFDCSDLLSDERLMLGTGDLDDDYFKDIQGAALTGLSEVNCIVFSPLHSVDESYYDKMRNELVRQYLVIRPLMEVNVRTATNIQENTLKNLIHVADAPDIGELSGAYEDVPFVLVGAGPSLDESIDFLKKIKDKAIIVASNSPFRKLINAGIEPHLVVTADPMAPTLAGFENLNYEHAVPMACPFSAYPEIVSRFSGRILTWSTFNPIVDYVKDTLGKKEGTKILEKGTVSGCVLDISKLLGCKRVYFVGQDMCVRDDGRYYSDDTSYSDSGAHYASSNKGQRLPGNTQEKVLVEGRLFVYLKTFEQFIKESPDVEYINLCRTGVRIEGAPYMDQNEALSTILDYSSHSFDSDIKGVINISKSNIEIIDMLKPIQKYTSDILEAALGAAVSSELLPEKFASTNYSQNKQIKNLLNLGGRINKLVDSNKLYWNFLFEGKTKAELIAFKRLARDIDFPNKSWAAIQRNKEYFWALTEGCHWLLNKIEEITKTA